MDKIKISMIEPVGGHGGMNYYDFGLCHGLTQVGVEVTLYTCDKTTVPDGLKFNIKKYFENIYGKDQKFLRAVRYLLGLIKSLRDARSIGSRIVHFHFFHTSLLEWVTIKLANLYGFKVLITAHDVESFIGDSVQRISRNIYSTSDIVIAHSQVSKKELIESLGLPKSKIRLIPQGNYIDFVNNNITQQQARERLRLQGKGPFLLFFGQIKRVKALDILINALPDVIKRFSSLQVIIAGKLWKDDFSKYQILIDKNKIGNSVILHIRYIPDELAGYYFQAVDLVVLPYRKIYQSAVLLMTMSYGRPVLVSDLEGMIEVIQDNVNGFVFRQGDSGHLAERLNEILQDTGNMAEVARAGYETATTQYSWAKIACQTAQVYRELD